jgi:hypothetical protein
MKSEECALLLPPLMPLAAPPTASAVLPKNVGQGAASRVGVRVNGGMVLGDGSMLLLTEVSS